MKPVNLLRLGVLLFAATCVDDREDQRNPTAPALSVQAGDVGLSTVCVAYQKELGEAQAQVGQALQADGDAAVEQRVAALNTAIADACR